MKNGPLKLKHVSVEENNFMCLMEKMLTQACKVGMGDRKASVPSNNDDYKTFIIKKHREDVNNMNKGGAKMEFATSPASFVGPKASRPDWAKTYSA